MFPRGVQRQDPLIHSEYELDFPSESIVFIYVIQIQIHIGNKAYGLERLLSFAVFPAVKPLILFPCELKNEMRMEGQTKTDL